MSDEVDQAEIQIATELANRIALIRANVGSGPGRENCIDCGFPIPEQRRAALPHATRCTPCQEELERSR